MTPGPSGTVRRMQRTRWVAALAAVLTLVAGCGPHVAAGGSAAPPASRTPSASGSASPTPPSTAPSPASPSSAPKPLRGKVIVLDAGHNDGNFGHTSLIDQLVDAGGFRKPCDTTGTETDAGYHEAAFTFDVTRRLTALLRADGARVVLTRKDDHSVGPCVNVRADVGNEAHADAALSVHADGNLVSGHGFHVMQPVEMSGGAGTVRRSHRLALAVRDAYRSGTGMPPANYIGTEGINPRTDMAGLNLSTVPKVLVECGNMRNSGDAALLTSAAFRQRIARSLDAAFRSYLS